MASTIRFRHGNLEKVSIVERRNLMSNNDNRVLSRMGARHLTPEEIEKITGSAATLASVLGTTSPTGPDDKLDQ
jgi:hypothetical protein